ncbi:adenylate cyclase, germination specific [Lucilia cuprina]|uniref:adenylate cyclase, germination specific n=1 Tax=Lucilia cuprina TaxID=7375 RepID=UPI001F065E79|nr:adenylate cyclase, germination specific [Lucilia cuprina]
MNIQQLSTSEHVPIIQQMQEHHQQQQQMFLPLNNPGSMQQSTAATVHVMPTPTTNWSMESMPWKITKADHTGDVMEFTAHAPHKNNAMRRALLHQKRKSEFNAIGTLPIKQFISEEKITAHFNGLHISSDYIQHNTDNITDDNGDEIPSTSGKCFSNLTYEDYQVTAKELEEKLRNANRITMCEELKKFNNEQQKVSYFPEALLHRINKPCTALVLWQPSPLMNIFSRNNNNNNMNENENKRDIKENETIEDYTIPDVDLPPEQPDEIDDFIDNNNSCNLDFNNINPNSMDEDL